MSLEHPQTSDLTMQQVYREIMKRAPEHAPQPSLERMRYVLDLLGHPEQSFKTIHITGTNGKGSTARLAEALVRTYGLRTGLYTSPHLEAVNERIAIDGQQLSDENFIDIYEQVIDFINLTDKHSLENGGARMSFFEVLTTMAIWAFADAPVDVAVIEVGMGGLWDATNVIDADAAIIGPVGMDHMQWLGDTVEKIATEKSGIIKPNCTAIIGPQEHESVEKILGDKARDTAGVTLLRDGEELEVTTRVPAVGGQMATLRTPNGTYEDVPISLFGEHQAHNALAALAAAEVVLPVSGTLDGDLVSEAFGSVKVPGRIEVVRTSPTIIIDGGHNVQAVTALRKAIEESFDFRQLVGIVSMMGDKQVEEVLGILEPLLSQIVVTQNSETDRVMPVDDLEKVAIGVFGPDRVTKEATMPDAIAKAVDLVDTEDELGVGYGHGVLITGSFVTAGDARLLLKETPNKDLMKKKSER
ncbi:MAG: bifunctional folylpolyglutamate synthase/dihydrofolate synthase [Bifidobacteriaceae bacterium]|nr:bifunctional folylpolyglutamate synthase/dihydrofolate synthase [Bifidobacteriaceae bacterium]MCI1978745.1 bifunctional folylpolyglutamate synthase/dihydrofolate synthase [Bifidobacteriaceae bacterium]